MTEDLIRSRGCEETILFKEVIVLCGTQIAWCHTRGECPMWRVACVCSPQLCGAVVKIVALWRSLREGYCVLRGSSDLDGCGQWLCRRRVAPGESLAALPEQLCMHCPEFCHRHRFPNRLSNHILTFWQALCLPQEKKLGLPHRWSSCQRSAGRLLSRTCRWTIGQLMHFSDANNEEG